MSSQPDTSESYLPDFCSGPMVLAVVLISELVAMVLALSQFDNMQAFWLDLARSSLFLLWVGMGSAAALCAARPLLARFGTVAASALAIALLLLVSLFISLGAIYFGQAFFSEVSGSPLQPDDAGSFLFRNLTICLIVSSLLLRYFYVAHQWRRNVVLEERSRFRALQARIRPHFLFNSMNTIASLTRSEPQLAEQATEDLADLFRASMADGRQRVPLKEELEMARLYQRIESLRLGERLRVRWNVDELPMHVRVPSLCLQPLLENAIYHGIEGLPEGGEVSIDGRLAGDRVELTVRNPVADAPHPSRRSGNRIALENIRQRFALAFDNRAKVTTEQQDGFYTVVLSFPAAEEPAMDIRNAS